MEKVLKNSIQENIKIDVLIVDDGSEIKPDLSDLLSHFSNSGNLSLEILKSNLGIEKALNFGLSLIQTLNYDFIGRLDCGDLARKGKFEKQINYLEKHPTIYLLGSWANIVTETYDYIYTLKHPCLYHEIKRKMYYNNCFVHPSVVFRSKVLETVGFYPEDRKYAEDFAYFFKIVEKHKVENLPEPLIDYVIAENSISTTKRHEQISSRIQIIKDHFYFGFHPIIGLIRNQILKFVSRNTVIKIKKSLNR